MMAHIQLWQKYLLCALLIGGGIFKISGQQYRYIQGWDSDINNTLEGFLNGTLTVKDRKVAVFDCDGTLLGQSPFYLADEALYQYAMNEYAGKNDSISVAKMKIVETMLKGDNVGVDYIKKRIDFLSGLTVDEVQLIGTNTFHEKYKSKIFPEMKQLLSNLEAYGFEIWILTASPEVLYQQFLHESLGIPMNRILGVKSVIKDHRITNILVEPVPQEEGKAEAIQTFIKAEPLLVAGNSRGDLEMMHQSAGLKMIVNPNADKALRIDSEKVPNSTLKTYWEANKALIVHCTDTEQGDLKYYTEDLGIRPNSANIKATP